MSRISKFHLNLLIAVATIIAYFSTVQNDFVDYDDNGYVTENAYIKMGLTTHSILYALLSVNTANYTPVTLLAYEAQVTLFGVDPWAMHATNLLIHLANSLLLFRFLRLMTNALYRSALVALLFAVHPLHVESVAWISELKDLLSTFFLLLTLLSYLRYCRQPVRNTYFQTLMLYGLGSLSKPMLVTLPILLVMMDVWVLNRWKSSRSDTTQPVERTPVSRNPDESLQALVTYSQKSLTDLLREKIPFFVLAFVIGAITVLAQAATGAVDSSGASPIHYRVANALSSYGVYLVKTMYPVDLCVLYLHPYKTLRASSVITGLLLVTIISVWVWRRSQSRLIVAFGWVWFLVTLLPVIGLLQVGKQAYADRYTYIPHIGLFVMIVWEVQDWLTRLPQPKIWSWILGIATVVPLMWLTNLQVRTWRNTETLWKNAIAVDPRNYAAYGFLGDCLLKQGNVAAGLSLLETAIKINPDDAYNQSELGMIFFALGDKSKAEKHFLRAIEVDPYYEKATQCLSMLYRMQNRKDEAIAWIKKYAELDPYNPRTQIMLADFYRETGELEESEQALQRALSLRPFDGQMRQQILERLQRLKQQMKAVN